MSRLTWLLVALIALLQYPLWLGKGGWLRVWDTSQQLAAQREVNQQLEQRNAGLDAEVRDLKSGFEAIEERARFELGFIKAGEVFVQVPLVPPPRGGKAP
ncbi:MAG: cell division protein FtsB [Rugosibacter sp.]|nr:cell division protein FtsB [Rugosibacter sp.]